MSARDFVHHHWPTVTIAVTAVAIAIAAVVMLRTMPPHAITMATGGEGGAYYELGRRYRAELERAGVEVRLVPTRGSLENLALLRDPKSGVSVGLVQGGTMREEDAAELQSLGTIFYEPFWLFYRREFRITGPDGLRGRRIWIGPEGSGTRMIALELLKRNGIDARISELLDMDLPAALEKLRAGEIDVLMILTAWESATVQQLIADERIGLATFPRADAYLAFYPYLNKVVLPRGVGDLGKDLPPADVVTFAPKASLVIRKDLHPALQFLLLNAASHIHSRRGVFQRAGEFPAAEAAEIPLSDEALQFYKTGRPFLHDHLPFWMATLIGKLVILLIPILGVLLPMMRFLPGLYDWMMRSRVSRLYGELHFLEDEITAARSAGRDLQDITTRLDDLEGQANRLRMPVAYASMMYILRNHIDLVRERLRKEAAGTSQRRA